MKELDRYRFHQFRQNDEIDLKYLHLQEITNDVYSCENLHLGSFSKDFQSKGQIKNIERSWINLLPNLKNVKRLSVRHTTNQDFFDSICNMTNLEELHLWTSRVDNISNIIKLKKLQYLSLDSFSRLTDISPIIELNELQRLYIENCFKIENFEVIGNLRQLIGLALIGYPFGPRNLRIKSLKPFENLINLKHLDLSSTSVIDNSYESVLCLENLERFDISIKIPKQIRDKIKVNHKRLTAGLFIDWDFDNNKLSEDKEW